MGFFKKVTKGLDRLGRGFSVSRPIDAAIFPWAQKYFGIKDEEAPVSISEFNFSRLSQIVPSKQLTIGPGEPVPVIYGKAFVGAQILHILTGNQVIVGEQELLFLLGLGFGPINKIGTQSRSVGEIDDQPSLGVFLGTGSTIDGNDIATKFNQLTVSLRFGDLTQSPLPRERRVLGTQSVNQSIYQPGVFSGPFATFSTPAKTSSILLNIKTKGQILRYDGVNTGDFTFPVDIPDSPIESPVTLSIVVQWKSSSAPTFLPQDSLVVTLIAKNDSTVGFSKAIDLPNLDIWDFKVSLDIPLGASYTDRFGVARPTQPQVMTVTVDSITIFGDHPFAYPEIALVEINGLLTQELNSEAPKSFILEVEGRLVPQWDGLILTSSYSTNPAWIALDILLDKSFGLGEFFTTSRIDLDSFKIWADFNDQILPNGKKRHEYNRVFNSEGLKAWNTVLEIMATGQAKPRFSNGNLTVIPDTLRVPIMLLGPGVIAQGSVSMNYRGKEDLLDSVTVNFFDDSLEGARNSVTARLDKAQTAGVYRNKKISRAGITDRDEAGRAAKLELNKANLIRRSLNLTVSLEGLSLLPGDLFEFSWDGLGYGQGGRLPQDSTNTTSIQIDRKVSIQAGSQLVIQSIIDDTLETVAVLSPVGSYSPGSIIVVAPLSFVPKRMSQYSIGLPASKPFEVQSIDLTTDFLVRVQAVEYIPAVYDDTVTNSVVTYTQLPQPGTFPSDVINLEARNVGRAVIGGGTLATIGLTWEYQPTNFNTAVPSPIRSEIFIRITGSQFWQQAGSVVYPATSLTVMKELDPGTTYDVVVVPVGPRLNKRHPSKAPFVTILYTGFPGIPPGPTDAVITDQGATIRIDWTPAIDETNIDVYEVRYGEGWQLGEIIYSGKIPSVTTGIWSPSIQINLPPQLPTKERKNRYYIRSKNFAGQYSAHAEVVEISKTIRFTLLVQRQERGLLWPGLAPNLLAQNGDLVLSTGMISSGSYTSPTIDTGSLNPKDLRVQAWALQFFRAKDWTSPGKWFGTEPGDGELFAWDGPISEEHMKLEVFVATAPNPLGLFTFIQATQILGFTDQYVKIFLKLSSLDGDLTHTAELRNLDITIEEI